MQLKSTNDEMNDRVFGMVAGPPSVGKTTQMTTFPANETLGVSIEDGFLSLKGSGYQYVELDPDNTYKELTDLISNLKEWFPGVKYLYIDSLTEMFDQVKHTEKGNFTASQNFAKFDEIQDQMLHCVRLARQLSNVNVFFTCHTKEMQNGMQLVQELAFDGKLPTLIKKQFDLIVHMDFMDHNGQKIRAFKTSPEVSHVAKRRVSPWLNIQVEDYEEPNLYKLTQKLLGK